MRKNKSGFTLMEILLVAVMMATIAIAVTQAFTNGLKLWMRSQHLVVESDLMIFFDKFGEDARGLQPMGTIAFKGMGSKVSWPTTVLVPADMRSARAHEELVDQIGAVQYYFDAGDKKIYRRQANYAQAVKGQWGPAIAVASNIEEMTVRYFQSSAKGLEGKSQIDGVVPVGMSVSLRFVGDLYDRQWQQFFPIAVGGGI